MKFKSIYSIFLVAESATFFSVDILKKTYQNLTTIVHNNCATYNIHRFKAATWDETNHMQEIFTNWFDLQKIHLIC